MTSARRRLVLPTLGMALVMGACGRAPDPAAARWIQAAARAHGDADGLTDRGELEAARSSLAALVLAPVPAGIAAEDRRAVIMDACYRLTELDVRLGRPSDARAWAERGLAAGERQDLFTANLLVALGHAWEAGGEAPRATASYHRALLINEALMHEALGEHAGGRNP